MNIKDVIHYYLGQPMVNTWFPEDHEMHNNDWKLKAIDLGNPKTYCLSNEEHDTWTEEVKPILRPLSSMTEEERKEFDNTTAVQRASPVHQFGVKVWTANTFHYLLSRGFDLFSLIENNLAMDATKLINSI